MMLQDNLRNDVIYHVLWEDGVRHIIERNNEPYLDYVRDNGSYLISAKDRLKVLIADHKRMLKEEKEIEGEELTSDRYDRLQEVEANVLDIEWLLCGCQELIERYKLGKIKLPVDVSAAEDELQLKSEFSHRFLDMLGKHSKEDFEWLVRLYEPDSGYTLISGVTL